MVRDLLWSAAVLATLWLQYTGQPSPVLAVTVATLVLDSALSLLLILPLAIRDAAASTAATMSAAALAVVLLRCRALRVAHG